MSLYEPAVVQPKKMLAHLERWLDAGVAYAQSKSFDFDVLLASRLAPDQYSLRRQVQSACDQAKFGAARLVGREAPKHADGEQSLEELRARIHACSAFLDTFNRGDFAGLEEKLISIPFLEGKSIEGSDYVNQLVIPNFYFHLATAYAILRHNGVNLGKRDFVGQLDLR